VGILADEADFYRLGSYNIHPKMLNKFHLMGILVAGILLLLPSVNATSYVHGAGGQLIAKINESGNITYYHSDHLGSSSVMTDEGGKVTFSADYLPFGEQFSGSGFERYQFTGKELGETELFYFGLRFYDYATGRFISVDPLRDGINWYVYVRNNPLKFVDPTGGNLELSADKDLLPEGEDIESDLSLKQFSTGLIDFLGRPEVEEVLGFNPVTRKDKTYKIILTNIDAGDENIISFFDPRDGIIRVNAKNIDGVVPVKIGEGIIYMFDYNKVIYAGVFKEIVHNEQFDTGYAPVKRHLLGKYRKKEKIHAWEYILMYRENLRGEMEGYLKEMHASSVKPF